MVAHVIPNAQDQQADIRRFIPIQAAVSGRNREGGLRRRSFCAGDGMEAKQGINGVGPTGGSGGTES